MTQPAKVYVVIYTVYHHVHKLAVEVQKGLESTGVSAKLFQGKSLSQTRKPFLCKLNIALSTISARNLA